MNIRCGIGITFLLSSIFIHFLKDNDVIFYEFSNSLNSKQREKYNKIVGERLMIYTIGLIIGLLAGLYYLSNTDRKDKYRLCTFIAIVYILQLIIYYIYPKHPLMVNYLNSKEQIRMWAKIYNKMKSRWIKSLLLGFIGYILISYFSINNR